MGAVSRRHLLALCCVALVLLAGCSGGVPFLGSGGDGAGEGSAGGSGAGSTHTTTAARTETGGSARPYDGPLNGTRVLAAHAEAVRAAGSVTVTESANLSLASGSLGEFGGNQTTRADLETGAVHSVSTSNGTVREVYRTRDGLVFVRERPSTGGESTYPPPGPYRRTVNRTRLVRPRMLSLLDEVNATYVGTATVGNETVYRYEANGTDDVTGGTVGGLRTANLSRFAFHVAVTADGLVRQYRTTMVSATGGQSVRLTTRVTYQDVGTTTVRPPSWLDAARVVAYERGNRTPPGLFENVTVRDDDLGAVVDARVMRDDAASVTLTPAPAARYHTGPVDVARVGPVVGTSFPASTLDNETTLTLAYSEVRVPDGEEDRLTVRRFSPRYADSVPVSGTVTVHPDENRVTVRGLEADTSAVVLVHGPTFEHEKRAEAARG